ncbi:MAG: hypothetical protein QGM50_11170 [Anaerolineae bacterium]|nr:hypothetical protein [Anaerolineae bacterium]MDK1081906.1 hypothetical protein [Anaerolineae bacterium]MDK1119331.1 hypothetical protein [Anaerolineae bacterium]
MIQFIIFISPVIVLALILSYLAWFRADKMQQWNIDQINKWPKGIPFKQLNLRYYEWSGWIWLFRISVSIFLLFSLCGSMVFLYFIFLTT